MDNPIPYPETPELEKIKGVSNESQAIGEFVDWLQGKGYVLCVPNRFGEFIPAFNTIHKLLVEYYGIDEDKAEQERRAILEYLRSIQPRAIIIKQAPE